MTDTPLPPPTDPTATAEPSVAWWKRKRAKLPTWAWIAIAVTVLFIAAGAAGGTEEETEDSATASSAAVSTTEPDITTTLAAPTTTEATTTTAAPTTTVAPTTTAAPTTTELVLTVEDIQTLVFPLTFDANRAEVIGILDENFVVQSVDEYTYDPIIGVVRVSITPAFDFDEGVRDDAFEMMRAMAAFWSSDGIWVESGTGWSPSLNMSISSAEYLCNGEQMKAMADARFAREQWDAECRLR